MPTENKQQEEFIIMIEFVFVGTTRNQRMRKKKQMK